MKAIKEFHGVRAGDIYPSPVKAGEEIPPELEEAAVELGAVEGKIKRKPPETGAAEGAPETK